MKHIVHEIFLNPVHKCTVDLIGAGGTGSQVIAHLGRIDKALKALEHPGLQVRLIDDDIITESNLGRQNFHYGDIGNYKADTLIKSINRFYGVNWESINRTYQRCYRNQAGANITISCVDSVASRKEIADRLKDYQAETSDRWALYWIDCGNSNSKGQVIVGTTHKYKGDNLTTTVEKLKESGIFDEDFVEDNSPSCSLAQSLKKQDLMINPAIALYASQYVWSIVRKGVLYNQGVFVNLESMKNSVIPFKKEFKGVMPTPELRGQPFQ